MTDDVWVLRRSPPETHDVVTLRGWWGSRLMQSYRAFKGISPQMPKFRAFVTAWDVTFRIWEEEPQWDHRGA
jgi:hypothetical protein